MRALTLNEKHKDLSLLNRYQTRLNKQVTLDLKDLEERQRIRKAAELKQFQLAAAFCMRNHLDRKPWDPAQFGFVWSAEEISRHVDIAILRRDAGKVAGGHKEIVYEDPPKQLAFSLLLRALCASALNVRPNPTPNLRSTSVTADFEKLTFIFQSLTGKIQNLLLLPRLLSSQRDP